MKSTTFEFFYLVYLFTIVYCNHVKTASKRIDLICFDDDNNIGVNCEIVSEVGEVEVLEVIGIKGKSWNETLKNDKLASTEIIEIVLVNSSTRMPHNIGVHFINIKNLIIHDSSLQHIKRPDFNYIERIEKLQLYNNRIESIDSDAFQNLTSLEYLDLDNNLLTVLYPDLFKFSPDLKVFMAVNNNIMALDKNLFEANHKLRSLNIRGNKIQNFDFILEHRKKLVHLAFINIRDNGALCNNFIISLEKFLETSKTNTMMRNKKAERFMINEGTEGDIIPLKSLNVSYLNKGMFFKNVKACSKLKINLKSNKKN